MRNGKLEVLSYPVGQKLNAPVEPERRSVIRIAETLPVKLQGTALDAYLFSLDVGLGGIRIFWNWPLIVGHQYDLSIALTPLKAWIRVRAEVLWQVRVNRQVEIALKFVDISRSDRRKLEEYVQKHFQKRSVPNSEPTLSSSAEKREQKRVSGRFPLKIWPSIGGSAKTSSGLIVDISLSGARFTANSFFLKGEEVELQIQIRAQQVIPLQLSGKIVRSDRLDALKRISPQLAFLHAVKFHPYSAELKRILGGYLDFKNSTKELTLAQNLLATAKN